MFAGFLTLKEPQDLLLMKQMSCLNYCLITGLVQIAGDDVPSWSSGWCFHELKINPKPREIRRRRASTCSVKTPGSVNSRSEKCSRSFWHFLGFIFLAYWREIKLHHMSRCNFRLSFFKPNLRKWGRTFIRLYINSVYCSESWQDMLFVFIYGLLWSVVAHSAGEKRLFGGF